MAMTDMKQKRLAALMAVGAALMVAGVFATLFAMGQDPLMTAIRQGGAAAFLLGTLLFVAIQVMGREEGRTLVARRLYRIQGLAGLFLVVAGFFMVEHAYHLVYPLFAGTVDGLVNYYHYVYNNWAVWLLIGGVLEVYTTLRLSAENDKEQ